MVVGSFISPLPVCTTLTHVKTAAPRPAITWKSRSSLNLENLSAIFRTQQQQLLCLFRRCPREARATPACTRPTSPPACGWQAGVYVTFTIHLITFPPQYCCKQPYLTETKEQCYSPFKDKAALEDLYCIIVVLSLPLLSQIMSYFTNCVAPEVCFII